MDFGLTDDQRDIQRTARDLLADRARPERMREHAEAQRTDDGLWRELGGLGWPGIAIAEEHGGQGLGAVELTILCEELGRSVAPVPFLPTVLAATLLEHAGSEAQRDRWLPGLAAGELLGAAGRADLLIGGADAQVIVLLEDEGARVLTPDDAEVISTASIDPTRSAARVEASADAGETLAGDVGAALDRALVAVASELVGVCDRALEMTVAYVKERRQFGVPVGAYQAVSHRCAQMLLDTERARSLTAFAAWTADADRDRLGEAAAMAKAAASDAGREVTSGAIQAHGGIGFTWEADVHWLYKRAQVDAALLGGAKHHRARLAALVARRLAAPGCGMNFAPTDRATEFAERLQAFMDERVYPVEREAGPEVVEELKAEARSRGLWNLFLPDAEHGPGLTNLEYAPLAEIMGRTKIASEACNCSAPDTGNMEVLHQFGSEAQKDTWLRPLLDGEIRSAFAMTEPDVASSDATNIAMRIERDGDDYVLNGRKWWTTGALHPHCRILIVMGKTDPEAPTYQQQSMVLVPMGTPGLEVLRGLPVFGYHDPEGHGELSFTDVRVPADNLIAGEGAGFLIAQARLGPGRIHHCMRAIGAAERALELLCRRADARVTFGEPISKRGNIRDWIAESRIELEMARLLVLKTAWLMDTVGNRHARMEIAAIKVAVPEIALKIVDRAIQVHGGGGVSDDFPLAQMWAGLRTLRLADGPDEVHKQSVARHELRRHREPVEQ